MASSHTCLLSAQCLDANLVAYKVRCLQTTTLGSQILEAATWKNWLSRLNKLKHVEVFCLRRLMAALYILNIGFTIFIWFHWKGEKSTRTSYNDDDYYYDEGDDEKYPEVDNSWIYYYGLFLGLAFFGALTPWLIDFAYWIAIDCRLKAAFDLSLSFSVKDHVNLGFLNVFLEISQTQRIELAETDLSNYALAAALEGTAVIKIMLYKKSWHSQYYGWPSQMIGQSTFWVLFWLALLVTNVGYVYLSNEDYFEQDITTTKKEYINHTYIYTDDERTRTTLAPVQQIWWNFLWAHCAAIGLFLALNILVLLILFAFGIINIVLCGLLSYINKLVYEETKKKVLFNVDPNRKSIPRFSTLEQ